MDTNRRFPLILSSFWIKIIALITMTVDHVGFLFFTTSESIPLRCIGRIAFPLFCFMIAEGVLYTKSFKKYALRLGIMASVISLALIGDELLNISGGELRSQGNIYIDLLLGALAVYFLKQEKWYLKLLVIIPLGLSIASFIAASMEWCGCHGKIIWYPYFLRGQYDWYAVLLIILFYVVHLLKDAFIKVHSNTTGINVEFYKDTNLERHVLNIFSVIMIIAVTLLHYCVGNLLPPKYVPWQLKVQLCAMISGAFILLYNGKRGYNKKWFQYGSYLYYPVHLIILYGIYLLTMM